MTTKLVWQYETPQKTRRTGTLNAPHIGLRYRGYPDSRWRPQSYPNQGKRHLLTAFFDAFCMCDWATPIVLSFRSISGATQNDRAYHQNNYGRSVLVSLISFSCEIAVHLFSALCQIALRRLRREDNFRLANFETIPTSVPCRFTSTLLRGFTQNP